MSMIKRNLGQGFSKWKNLRYLYLECTFPRDWDTNVKSTFPSPYWIDDLRRPLRYALEFKLYYDEHFDCDFDDYEEYRQFFIDCGLECHEDTCLMQLWKETHENAMAFCVRHLASNCITLEVFEWRMRPQEFGTDEDDEELFDTADIGTYSHPLWRWNIHRRSDGSMRMVSGYLTWNGQPNHPPSPGDRFKKYKI
jgi:hypothetical protein